MINVFIKPEIADSYDAYYQTDFGKRVDEIEKGIISSLIKDISRSDMLELGCGTGHWTEYFVKLGFHVTGVDISDPMLSLAKSKGIHAEFIHADSQRLPFNNESFDIISSITMLEFVDDQDKVLQQIYRILKPEGWLILGCLNANSVIGKNKDKDETFKNARFLTPEELTDKLQLFGKPKLNYGVYVTPGFSILDNTSEKGTIEPVFMAAMVQKIN